MPPYSSDNNSSTSDCGSSSAMPAAVLTDSFFPSSISRTRGHDDNKMVSSLKFTTYIPESLFSIQTPLHPPSSASFSSSSMQVSSRLSRSSGVSDLDLLNAALNILDDSGNKNQGETLSPTQQQQQQQRSSPPDAASANGNTNLVQSFLSQALSVLGDSPMLDEDGGTTMATEQDQHEDFDICFPHSQFRSQ